MYCRTLIVAGACIGAAALSAQTPPQLRFPGMPQFTVVPQAPPGRPKAQVVLRNLLKRDNQETAAVCSIPLLEVHVLQKLERMPFLRPPEGNIDNMPSVKVPAPPCQEEKR